MYNLKVLPSVRKEIIKIRDYIADDLSNVPASINLMKDIQKAFTQVEEAPRAFSYFNYDKKLKHEYKKKVVNGYVLLYWVDEGKKLVTVSFIFHTKRNYKSRIL